MTQFIPWTLGRTTLAGAILFTQVFFAHQVEAHFWAQRADAARRLRGESSAPSEQMGWLTEMTTSLSGIGTVTMGRTGSGSVLSKNSFPPPLRDEVADLVTALLPHATLRSYRDAGPGTPFVIHLQDVHGHLDAQRNITNLLSEIVTRRPGTPIALEGGAGPIALPSLNTVSVPAIRRTAAFFFNTGIISGAEVAALTAPVGTPLHGAENPELYLANVEAVQKAALLHQKMTERLSAWRTQVETKADQTLTPELRAFNDKTRRWASGTEGLSDRAHFLWTRANSREHPELKKFMEAARTEEKINLIAVQQDRRALLTNLEERMASSAVSDLAHAALAFRSGHLRPGDFYRTLRNAIHRSGLTLNPYPHFEAYVRYVILADSIQPEILQEEMERLESSLWNRLAKTPEEHRQVALIRDLRLMEGLATLTLTPQDWTHYLERSAELHQLPHRMNEPSMNHPTWIQELTPFEQFYTCAEARNSALAKNVSALFTRTSQNRPLVVLVAGGFHSAGLAPIFAAQGISVLTLSPKLSEAGHGTPFDLFTRERTPLERLFESPRITLSQTLALQPIGDSLQTRTQLIKELGPRLGPLLEKEAGDRGSRVHISEGDPVLLTTDSDGLTTDSIRQIVAGGSLLAAKVPTSLQSGTTVDTRANDPSVYVYTKRINAGREFLRRATLLFVQMKSHIIRALGVSLLSVLLLPLTPSLSAQAATFSQMGDRIEVMVHKGEHLWGVAQKILDAQGVRVTLQATAKAVQDLARANAEQIPNPDLIYPGVSYTVPSQLLNANTRRTLTERDSPGATEKKPRAEDPPEEIGRIVPQGMTPDPGPPDSQPEPPRSLSPERVPEIPPQSSPSAPTAPGFDISYFLLIAGAYVLRATRITHSALGYNAMKDRAHRFLSLTTRQKNASRRFLSRILPHHLNLQLVGTLGIITLLIYSFPTLIVANGDALGIDLAKQWPVELVLTTGVGMAIYFIWWRPKEVDLSLVEKTDPRLMEWISGIEEMKTVDDLDRLESDFLLPLLNNLHALILNHQITSASVTDRGTVEKQIDIYRSIARLSRDTVFALDQRLDTLPPSTGGSRERITDIREKIFLYQLYALKVSHILVNASVAHWAFSHFDKKTSWFERWGVGGLLRTVRGVRRMIDISVHEFNRQTLQDNTIDGDSIWANASGLSVASLGNVLVPGLYSEEKKASLSSVFSVLVEKAKTKILPDITGKDLHRKGISTLLGLLVWTAAISMTFTIGHATLAFLTGLGLNMALFRLQAAGTRRDAFYRKGLAEWHQWNKDHPHSNGRIRKDESGKAEDPFHLNRDSIRSNFQKAEEALLREILPDGVPSADLILLVAKNESERAYYEERQKDTQIFRPDVPVIILSIPEGRGSLMAYATAALYPYSDDFTQLVNRYPHLKDKAPWELRMGTMVSKSPETEDMRQLLRNVPGLSKHLSAETVANRTVFDLGIMNIYRATQARASRGLGGMALRWSDRAYIGPVRTAEGDGITLDTFWANKREMARYHFGAVVGTPGKPIKLIRLNGIENTLRVLSYKHPGRVYDSTNLELDQYQGFSGEGFYALDEAGSLAQKKFLASVLKRYGKLKTKPSLSLVTNYLIPAQIAQRHRGTPGTIPQKIVTFFAQNGFLSRASSTDLERFNLKNARRSTAFANGHGTIRLNANPVEGYFYGGASFPVNPQENGFYPRASVPGPGAPVQAVNIFHAMGVAWAFLGSALHLLGTGRGIFTAFSVPILAVWLFLSPVGLMASRVSQSGRAGASSLLRSRRDPKFITNEAWSRPETDLNEITAAMEALKKNPDPRADRSRRALARLGLTLIATAPLQNNLLDGLDVNKTRRIMQRTAPGAWAEDFKEEGQPGAAGMIRRISLRSLAHQIAEIQRGTSPGNQSHAAQRQSAFLAGLADLDRESLEDLSAFLKLLSIEKQEEPLTNAEWDAAVSRGETQRKTLREWIQPTPTTETPESTFTALRVTELIPGASGTTAQRNTLLTELRQRVSSHRTGQDVLVINGSATQGRNEKVLRESLGEKVKDPALLDYLTTVQIVVIPENRFAPEHVRTQLPKEFSRLSMDLLTVHPAAVLVDPLQTGGSDRVLLLELWGGILHHVDLINVARQAMETARVLSSAA
jgi:hypothetical protein